MKRTLLLLGVVAGAAASAQTAPDGAALYAQHCATCHLADGVGQAGLAPALKGDHWVKLGAERAYLPTVLVHGLAGAIKVNGQTFIGVMAAFGGQLDDATLAALATHVRRLQGADAKPYVADEIKAVRDKVGDQQRTRLWRTQLLGP